MLLSEPMAERALEVLRELSKRLLRLRGATTRDPFLAQGHAGLALTHAALDAVFPEAGHARHAELALGRAVGGLATTACGPSLFLGFAGVAWVAEILAGDPTAAAEDDANAEIDSTLAEILATPRWSETYDLMRGLVGFGIYALERMPRPSAAGLLDLIVEHLATSAQDSPPGLTWWTDPSWGWLALRPVKEGEWCLGAAHGVAGIVGLLGRIVAAPLGIETLTKARRMLSGGVAWLLARELAAKSDGCFSAIIRPGQPPRAARLAWCNGDLGIAAALLLAARGANEPSWAEAGKRIALLASTRAESTAGVLDFGLCHGAAGNAHVFHRLFRMTGEERLAEASRAWFARALALRAAGRGIAGFRAFSADASGRLRWWSDPGFLSGAGGLALALAAAMSDDDPSWDRLLLLP